MPDGFGGRVFVGKNEKQGYERNGNYCRHATETKETNISNEHNIVKIPTGRRQTS